MKRFIAVITPVVDTGHIAVDPTLAPFRSPDCQIRNFFLDDGPSSVETAADVTACLPGLLRRAAEVTALGADAIVINCMCDPGAEELRTIVTIPVLAPAQASMHVAAASGLRFTVLDVLADCRAEVEEQVQRYGVGSAYVSHRAMGIPVIELFSNPERTLAALEREAMAAVHRDGAQLLLLGCTGLAELADDLNSRLAARGEHCRILEPLRTTLQLARMVLNA